MSLIGALGEVVKVFESDKVNGIGANLIKTGDSLKSAGDAVSKLDVSAILKKFDETADSIGKKDKKVEGGESAPIEKSDRTGGPVVLQATGHGLIQMDMQDKQTKLQEDIAKNTKRDADNGAKSLSLQERIAKNDEERLSLEKEQALSQAKDTVTPAVTAAFNSANRTGVSGATKPTDGVINDAVGSGYTANGIHFSRSPDDSMRPDKR